MQMIKPDLIRVGDTIGLVTPSSPLMPGRLEAGIKFFEGKGYKVKVGKHNQKENRFLAGSDDERAQDLITFFKDPDIKAIIVTGGGYGSQRLLPLLDYDLICNNPKALIGFSDTTALQLGLLKKSGLVSYTGFTCSDVHSCLINNFVGQTLMACFKGQSYHIQEGIRAHGGIAQGYLIGGNLGLIIALLGTPYQPDFSGSILLIEAVLQEPYKVDCMLSQLVLAGVFDQVAGVIFGQFEHCIAEYFPERDGTIDDVINEWTSRMQVPCLKNFPYGHGKRRCVLPIGGQVTLNADTTTLRVDYW